MQEFVKYLAILGFLLLGSSFADDIWYPTYDVRDYGAVGDGITDDTKGFESAWEAACKKGSGNVEILGNIVAPPRSKWRNTASDKWLYFHKVDGLTVIGNGQGIINGNGQTWWLDALSFINCNGLIVRGLKHVDSQENHISVIHCQNVMLANLHIVAPAKSPNTDGIRISRSTNVDIHDSIMETGDDCIAITGGSSRVKISGIACGPGHGISIGSLGKDGAHDEVEAIAVSNCSFRGTQNGVRIKTWQGGSGFARSITFSNINFIAAYNPVIIDQYYCPHKTCVKKESAVKVSNVKYVGLRGTSMTKIATVNFNCSQTVPCTDILVDDVNIVPIDQEAPSSQCIDAHVTEHRSNIVFHCRKTWEAACTNGSGNVEVRVPPGNFSVSRLKFQGPCKARSISFQILGNIVAPPRSEWRNTDAYGWLYFDKIDGLTVTGKGRGIIHGNGQTWWLYAITFSKCNGLIVRGLKHINSPRNHISITKCKNVTVTNLHIVAPDTSPNTDGINIIGSTNISIHDSIMETGDDCIAINGGTSQVNISGIACGPGHGISIGSLGKDGAHEEVEAIAISNSSFLGTQNGVRIKTWQGGSGFARNIHFANIKFNAAYNPVIIDQYYCPHRICSNQESAVKVSNVTYVGLRGTFVTNAAVIFKCSQTVHCTGILVDNVNIGHIGNEIPSAQCINAYVTERMSNLALNCSNSK
ncbi:putative polygalacturonase-like [Dorcoceras hygrometricum]|uniref:Putative polygalacturonase-like n=1 Tax=Dorcoceras hygrometricum TaxID=472368 RepID=A0A2Z7CVM8_9LAMI|nr:putative polygalacturonase-like [Dorcoceras hygrometricum]